MKHALKLKWLIALFLFFGTTSAFAQTAKDVFTNSETQILYLGIDFTKVKVIDELTVSEFDLRDKYFPGINDVVVNTPKKFARKLIIILSIPANWAIETGYRNGASFVFCVIQGRLHSICK